MGPTEEEERTGGGASYRRTAASGQRAVDVVVSTGHARHADTPHLKTVGEEEGDEKDVNRGRRRRKRVSGIYSIHSLAQYYTALQFGIHSLTQPCTVLQ
jgi:hypothetical protein